MFILLAFLKEEINVFLLEIFSNQTIFVFNKYEKYL